MTKTTAKTGEVFQKKASGEIWFFLGKRFSITLLTLFLVSLLTFLAFAIIPGDPALLALGIEASDEQLRALRTEMGLDRGLAERYWVWLGKFLSGDLGNSARFRGPLFRG